MATAAARSPLEAALPEYELLGELGRGAMGVVLAGRHRSLDRSVAIKELPAAFAADDAIRQRFLREAQTLAALNHPHVVQVFDFVDRNGHLALIMEQLPGGTVWTRFTTQGLSAPVACGLILSAAAGLDHAHRHGVLHRDVKPENLMFTDQGRLKVTDFGIAKVMGGERTLATADGAILGTPAYMAPEQAEGLTVGPPADVYACGTMLYEMLSGQLPFAWAGTPMATLIARIKDDAPPLGAQAPLVPPAVADVADVALARQPEQRFQSVEDFAVALGQAAAGSWGPYWLTATGLSLTGSDAIEWAVRTARPAGGGTLRFAATGAGVAGVAGAGVAGVAGSYSPGLAPSTVTDQVPLRPSEIRSGSGLDLAQLSLSDVVDITRVRVRVRPNPAGPWLVALFIALAAVGVGFGGAGVGFGGASASGADADRSPGLVVAGQPVDGVNAPAIDFSRSFDVAGLGPGAQLRLAISSLGVPLGVVEVPLSAGSATVAPGYLRWTTAGAVEVSTSVDGQARPADGFIATAEQPWLLTAPTVALALLGLFGLASLSSNLKALGWGRWRLGSLAGLTFAGAVTGAAGAGLVGLGAGVPLRVPPLVAGAALAALSALSLGEGYRRMGPRRMGPRPG